MQSLKLRSSNDEEGLSYKHLGPSLEPVLCVISCYVKSHRSVLVRYSAHLAHQILAKRDWSTAIFVLAKID